VRRAADRPVRGRVVEAVIEKGVYRGRGLARVDGQVVLVPGAYPGDRVLVRLDEVHAGWSSGPVLERLDPAPERRDSPCPYVPRCGGCAYQDLAYEAQLSMKEAILRESLARAGAPWEGPIALHPSPERGWRSRASLHFAVGEDGLRLGLHQEGTRRVVDVEACLQLSEGANRAARAIRDLLAGRRELWPGLRGLDLLEPPEGGGVVASLQARLTAREASWVAARATEVPGLAGLGVSSSAGMRWLLGGRHVETSVLGVTLRVHVRSFFQANRFLLEPFARAVVDMVPKGAGAVVDLYSGVGLFALPWPPGASRRSSPSSCLRRRRRTPGGPSGATPCEGCGCSRKTWPRPCRGAVPARARGSSSTPRGRARGPRWSGSWPTGRRKRSCTSRATRPPWAGTSRSSRRGACGPTPSGCSTCFPDTFHVETVVRLRPGGGRL
jgi:predicted RNA-binding protein with TRAM domain